MAQQAAKGMDHPDVKAMQAQRDERAKVTEAAMKRMDSSRPTPTQEENDLARLGVHVEQKQDDGSGPTAKKEGQQQTQREFAGISTPERAQEARHKDR